MGRMFANQFWQRGNRNRNRLDRSYRDAIARALKESNERTAPEGARAVAGVNWNRLVAELEDDLQQGRDKAPPEQYRRAIAQYFNEISRVAAEKAEEQQ
jgi:hypothetical protein